MELELENDALSCSQCGCFGSWSVLLTPLDTINRFRIKLQCASCATPLEVTFDDAHLSNVCIGEEP